MVEQAPTTSEGSKPVVPFVDRVISQDEIVATAETIAELQLASGMIQWFPGGHADPWNHVETAMALATAGFIDEAEAGYQWLADIQLGDGSWHNYYLADGIEDSKLDTNCIAYIATGVFHHLLATGDRGFAETMWPVVEQAIEFVLELQRKSGEIVWAKKTDGMPWSYALLTGSSSISHSLRCADLLATSLGYERPSWVDSRDRLVDAIVNRPDVFEPKDRWAMDWYYPVLSGAMIGSDAEKRMQSQWDTFVMDGKGVRCVSDRPWVTAAETCECAIALAAIDETEKAHDLFRWANALRDERGAYFTGIVFPELVNYPGEERSSYTAAAIILAADALFGQNPTSSLFTDHS